MSQPKLLMVLTSHDQLGDTGHKTGVWAEEFAAPYYAFLDAGCDVTLASPKGGATPIDPNSEGEDAQTDDTRRFYADEAAQQVIRETKVLSGVDASEFDAVFYPGGHGPLYDLAGDEDSIALIKAFLEQGKPVSAVCHAPAVFLNVKDAHGEYIIKGKRLTGFTNEEEAAVGLTEVVPYLLEDELGNRGADVKKVAAFSPFAIEDGLFITGQNPASSRAVADALLARFNR
ncbi:type 1 glutamine amidotransferase domain-containing protein [Larsenimonas suaedae]|uniref:Type 1 glutamine amidotransferase domain-containing protein n=1 Tax=Larsenimonas suaedae TaxID=1851019 RepID=A0ABU1GUD5_9GAMM|nr:type 1 glutamine amidotransferase domain-containing protein [Larsenimonas suaedae]MCM2972201.1 type 1 glutamine amidotransferase domain-containing protein [Larsenimonas suaedae]MDR5895003.1 type 1 glutamine amidotransferase domain-containing protein [Larsenimonas suaedae]